MDNRESLQREYQPEVDSIDDWNTHWSDLNDSATKNPAQDFRRNLIVSEIKKVKLPTHIIDLGCGQGHLLHKLKSLFPRANFLGIDASSKALELSKKNLPEILTCCLDLNQKKSIPHDLLEWGNILTCTEVLEHLENPADAISIAHSLLKSGGKILITVPGGVRSEYDLYIGHRQHFTIDQLHGLLSFQGFTNIKVYGAGFPFFNLYRLLVILKGTALIDEAKRKNMGMLAAIAMKAFDLAFRININQGKMGWQIFAVATKP